MIAETKAKTLVSFFITPNKHFYIRQHQATPAPVDLDEFKLRIFNELSMKHNVGTSAARYDRESEEDDEDLAPIRKFSVEDLRTLFTPYKVMNAMSCAGNRRKGLKEVAPPGLVQGNDWYIGAVGNAEYTGVLLINLLKELGFRLEDLKDKHLIAESMDTDVLGKCYEVSVPMSMVIDPLNEVILAYEMNGEALPLEHGFPLRLVVPGVVGVRNAKWVKALKISDEEATST
jgi:sulfite oxidase